ncbi:MAG: AraC family transcriptional regulator [Rudaea sp.]|uniref:AraC family transcriptional regulator n=1 Tax=unclassified Rudaea TaxID=2627037 RepID=UPI0010F9154E|nr:MULTISPECIES: AraC family transcriptional regulator [unclassified Rudaea]MBN8887945.1 AraC family transcriptional regulator [Rudaea sp.]
MTANLPASNSSPPPWAAVDPLGEALHGLHMSGIFYTRSEFAAPWGLALPALPQMLMFHVVTAGEGWLEFDGHEPTRLLPGDFILVPHGQGHRLVDTPGGDCAGLFDLPREALSARYEVLRHGGDGATTQMICGAVRFDHPAAQRLVALLPRLIRIEAAHSPHRDWMTETLRFMADEVRALRPGGETVVTRLADILVIQAIRAWIERDPAAQGGWLGALRDKQIGRAVTLLHREPGRAWTLAALAREAAMSRSAFAARFTALVGMPAMQYLTQWRMQHALTRLRERGVSVAALAEELGYQSEAAFSRTFKRIIGIAPGAARRQNNAETPAAS